MKNPLPQGIAICRQIPGYLSSLGFRIPGSGRPVVRIVVGLLFLPPALVFLWLLFLPWPLTLRWRNPGHTAFMEYRIEEAEDGGDTLRIVQDWVALEDISPNLRRFVLAAEDDRFYRHHGIDWRALAEEVNYRGDTTFSWWRAGDRRALREALAYGWAHRDQIRGRSTLTQQLAKNLYFTPRRSLSRKVAEAVVSKRLELFLPKDRILEIYLNVAEWGPGVFGAEAASRIYFGRGAADLTLDQAAALAATLPHPLTSNPSFRPARMEWRKAHLLSRLRGPPPPAPPLVEVPLLPDTALARDDTASGSFRDTVSGSGRDTTSGAGGERTSLERTAPSP
ncbi:MAG: biosynthetic peptidoglycan transglycosylase [Longimicrobiales bacterium]